MRGRSVCIYMCVGSGVSGEWGGDSIAMDEWGDGGREKGQWGVLCLVQQRDCSWGGEDGKCTGRVSVLGERGAWEECVYIHMCVGGEWG